MSLEPKIKSTVSTTDATVTTLATLPIDTNSVVGFDAYVICRRTGGVAGNAQDGGFYRIEFVANNASGTVTIIGQNIQTPGESQAGWDVSLTVSGTNILVRVTGATNNNITWRFTGDKYIV